MPHAVTPMLMCADVQESIAFYTEALGLEVVDRMDDIGRSGWASLRRGGLHLMLASPTYIPAGVKVEGRFPQSIYYFYTRDLEALRDRVLAFGAEATEISQRFYDMREFEVVDPDGHVLVFGEDSPSNSQGPHDSEQAAPQSS